MGTTLHTPPHAAMMSSEVHRARPHAGVCASTAPRLPVAAADTEHVGVGVADAHRAVGGEKK